MPDNFKKGDLVHYHSIIGGPHDGKIYTLRTDVQRLPSGHFVVWLEGKSGCVSVKAVSRADANSGR